MSQNEYLLVVWVTITVLAVSGMGAALIWAIRSHQFQQQDHARHLALESGIPSDMDSQAGFRMSCGAPNDADKQVGSNVGLPVGAVARFAKKNLGNQTSVDKKTDNPTENGAAPE